MFKLFNRKPQSRGFKAPLSKGVVPVNDPMDTTLKFIDSGFEKIEDGIKKLQSDNSLLRIVNNNQAGEITALKGIVSMLRKQKVYSGQRFYNSKDHKAPIVYLCARWNEWYMVRQQNEETPRLIDQAEWQDIYGGYELMPKPNTNLKNLR